MWNWLGWQHQILSTLITLLLQVWDICLVLSQCFHQSLFMSLVRSSSLSIQIQISILSHLPRNSLSFLQCFHVLLIVTYKVRYSKNSYGFNFEISHKALITYPLLFCTGLDPTHGSSAVCISTGREAVCGERSKCLLWQYATGGGYMLSLPCVLWEQVTQFNNTNVHWIASRQC